MHMIMRRCEPNAATPISAAAKTKRATGSSSRTPVSRFVTSLVLTVLPFLLSSRVPPVAATEQQWVPVVAREGIPGGRSTTEATVAGPGVTYGEEEAREEELSRCWIGENGRMRCGANVFFIGVSKCGTSTLANWMTHHPALRWVSNHHYIDALEPDRRVNVTMLPKVKGRKFFASKAPEAEEDDKVMVYCPSYAIIPEVPYDIREIYGESSYDGSIKYVITLREPAARAISSWEYKFHMSNLKTDDPTLWVGEFRTLEKSIQEGIEDVNGLLECLEQHPPPSDPWDLDYLEELDLRTCRTRDFYGEHELLIMHHMGKGMYALQLERWFALVGKENIQVDFLEERHDEPLKALESIFEFIGLDLLDISGKKGLASREEWERIVEMMTNVTDDKKKEILGRQATPEVVQKLRDFYAPHNARLEELLGRPLPDSWSTPASP